MLSDFAGGPVAPACATSVNHFARTRDLGWLQRHFERCAGLERMVYLGFMQLCGLLAMNPHRHVSAPLRDVQSSRRGRRRLAAGKEDVP
ncbi:hypothetical protein [Bradyrhizobium sp. USDA 10063]